jgi:hypothetical protein
MTDYNFFLSDNSVNKIPQPYISPYVHIFIIKGIKRKKSPVLFTQKTNIMDGLAQTHKYRRDTRTHTQHK